MDLRCCLFYIIQIYIDDKCFAFAEIFDQILKDEFIFPSTAWSLFHCHCNAGGWACLVIGSSYSTTAAGDKLWSEKYRPLLNMGADKKNVVVLG